MNPEKNLNQLPTINQENSLEKENAVEAYILGTLAYTPQFYAKSQKYVEIKVYAPDEQQPSMKIFRMIFRQEPLPQEGEDLNGLKEVAFQDEVSVLKDGKPDSNERWQVNFSVLVDEENFEYKSIRETPKKVSHLSESVDVFRNLSKQKGASLYAGDWRFESDGNGWVRMNSDGTKVIEPELKSLAPSTPNIE